MLLKQLETLGMVHTPTCLVGSGLARHSLVPDLLGPALAHHGLELGLASLRALDHLRVALVLAWTIMGLTLGSIGGSNLGSAGDSTKESSLTTKAFNVLGVVAILKPVNVFMGIKFKTHFANILDGN